MRTEDEIEAMMKDFRDHANTSTTINYQFSMFALHVLEWALSRTYEDARLKQQYVMMQIESALYQSKIDAHYKEWMDEIMRAVE